MKLGDRERAVLKAVALGYDSWSKVRSFIAERYGAVLPKSTLTRVVEKLERLSILRDYRFLDPVYREAAKTL